jgi:hypothetical protein
MIHAAFVIALGILPAAAGDQGSQTPAPIGTPAGAQEAVPVTPATAAPAIATPVDRDTLRDNISSLEGLFATAVANGAGRIQRANPGVTLTATGNPRARGFVLDGYGYFFDIEIPELNGSVELTMQLLQREIQRRLDEQSGGPRRTSQGAQAQGLSAQDDADPGAAYREAVLSSVSATMLDFTRNLNIQPNEWLVVGLRGSELPNLQAGIRDSRTVVLRIKGSDLGDYLASRISKDEALKRIDKREF